MQTRHVGRSGLSVPVLGLSITDLGTASNWNQVAEAEKLIRATLDAGVNLFDVRIGGDGMAEDFLAAALPPNRTRAIVATRFSLAPVSDGTGVREQLFQACDNSLRRLRTDYVDLWQLDPVDLSAPLDDVVRALDDLVRTGKVLYTGCCESVGWHLMKCLMLADDQRRTRLISHQVDYSVFDRHYEREHLELAVSEGIGTIARASACRVDSPVSRTLESISRETNRSVRQIALSWVLQQPTVCAALTAPRSIGELEDDVLAAGWSVPPSHLATLEAFTERPTRMIGPDSDE
jgi:aryl-alcohol dehydrogenase-like predicted oxidoreductase